MFEEDLSAFFDVEEHANYIVIQKSGEIFEGIIDKEYVEVNGMSGFEPVLTCKTSSLENVERGDILEDGKTQYVFIKPEPDGTGVTRAILEAL